MKIPTSWSYSSWRQHGQCAAQWKYQRIDRLPQGPPGPALERGTRVHKGLEEYLLGDDTALPKEAAHFVEELEALRGMDTLEVEHEFAIDVNGDFVDWKDWANAWMRVKMDALHFSDGGKTLHLIDFKTGKVRDFDRNQLELYGWFGLRQWPEVTKVKAELWYIDACDIDDEHEFKRKDLPKLERKWLARARNMLEDREWRPTPGYWCNWCDYNGAPCEEPER